jgi:ABC-2 type transport system ATP-binding protein
MPSDLILETSCLTKRYGPLTAVDCLTLQVERGEVFGFLGPNGAGKTTAIHMMCGLLKPDSGWARLYGKPVEQRAARRLVGVCPQQTVLWEKLTCLEQLVFVASLYGVSSGEAAQRARTLLADLGLGEKAHQLASKLSGGMQRRLNLALALIHEPGLVVLDEPEAGLDPHSRLLVREYLHELRKRCTIIITTHNMDEAERLADRVAIIDHGVLQALDSPQALKQRLGEGDVLEARLVAPPSDLAFVADALAQAGVSAQVAATSDSLTLRGLNLVGLLPQTLTALERAGLHPLETRLRANTLEDVFMHLTGRALRD